MKITYSLLAITFSFAVSGQFSVQQYIPGTYPKMGVAVSAQNETIQFHGFPPRLSKYSPEGHLLWTKGFQGDELNTFPATRCLAISDDRYAFLTERVLPGVQITDLVITDTSGIVLDAIQFPLTTDIEQGYQALLRAPDGFVLVGSQIAGTERLTYYQLADDGVVTQLAYGSSAHNLSVTDVDIRFNGEIAILAGISDVNGGDNISRSVLRLDPLGNVMWARTLEFTGQGTDQPAFRTITFLENGSTLLTGTTDNGLLVTLDALGEVQVARSFGSGIEFIGSAAMSDGGAVLAGRVPMAEDPNGATYYFDIGILRINDLNGSEWFKRFDLAPFDRPMDVATKDDAIYVVGRTGEGMTHEYVFLLQVTEDGLGACKSETSPLQTVEMAVGSTPFPVVQFSHNSVGTTILVSSHTQDIVTGDACCIFQPFAEFTSIPSDTLPGTWTFWPDYNNGQGFSMLWSFGDGTFSQEAFPTHSYAEFGVYEVCLVLGTGCGESDMYCEEHVFLNVGVEDRYGAGWLAFPNPNVGTVRFMGAPGDDQVVQCRDLTGKICLEGAVLNGTFDMSGLPSGWYLLSMPNAPGMGTQMVVLTK